MRIALEGLIKKCSQVNNFRTTPFPSSELKLQKQLSALEERLSNFINEKDDRSVVDYELVQAQDIKALYEAREDEVVDLEYRMQALAVQVNSECSGKFVGAL